jgi:hypothetical protein
MKVIEYEGNVQDCSFTYHRTREGPNFFVSHYKGSTKGHNDPKECWRTLGVAKFTDSGKALKQWCLDMDTQNSMASRKRRKRRPKAGATLPLHLKH